jgi:hypothetical protein
MPVGMLQNMAYQCDGCTTPPLMCTKACKQQCTPLLLLLLLLLHITLHLALC